MTDMVRAIQRLSPKARRRIKLGRKRGLRNYVKRPERSREELLAFLRDNDIRTSCRLNKVRQPTDPTVHEYIKEFGRWNDAKRLAFGPDIKDYMPKPTDGMSELDAMEYDVKVMIRHGAWSLAEYHRARKRAPHEVPSFYEIQRRWGRYINLKYTAIRKFPHGSMVVYLKLQDELGRRPTEADCVKHHLDLKEMVSACGSWFSFDRFAQQYRRMQEDEKRERSLR